MVRKARHITHDILETIERLQTVVSGKTFSEFQADWMLRFIVQRGIEIISEASRQIPAELLETRPEIHWRSIGGIGNVLRHEHHTVWDKIIWDVVALEFPTLKLAIEAIDAALDQ
jgi:uncharacterized protein with HEPN domain